MTGLHQGGGGDAAPSPTAGFREWPVRQPVGPEYRMPMECACGRCGSGHMENGGLVDWLTCGEHAVVHTMARCWLQDAEGRDLREVARR